MAKPKHAWPTGQPVQKRPRTCATCGMHVFWTKHKDTPYSDYRWVIAWTRGPLHGTVDRLRDAPACEVS